MLTKLLWTFLLATGLHLAVAQTKSIAGKITDDKGVPLMGALVVAKGSSVGVATNSSGNFNISIPSSVTHITVSFLGYETQTVSVSSVNTVSIKLVPRTSNMDAVVVVGYGTQRRRDITGSVASVRGDVFKDQPITNPISALQGRIAGVNVVQSSGAPMLHQALL